VAISIGVLQGGVYLAGNPKYISTFS